MSSLTLLPIQAANIVIKSVCCCTAFEWSTMQNQQSLTLRWRLVLDGSSDIVAVPGAYDCSQYSDYGLTLSHSPGIIHDTTPEIGDAPLTLISRLLQQACCLPFYIYRERIIPRWIDVTMQPIDWREDETKIVEAPFTLTIETYQQNFGMH